MKTHLLTSGFANDSNGNMTSFPTSSGTQGLSYDVENRTGGLWFDLEGQPLDRGGTWNLYGAHGERLETVSISAAHYFGTVGLFFNATVCNRSSCQYAIKKFFAHGNNRVSPSQCFLSSCNAMFIFSTTVMFHGPMSDGCIRHAG